MAKKSIYKYINLLFRVIVGLAAVVYIYYKIKEDWLTKFNHIDILSVEIEFLVLAFILIFLNWGLEAQKWRYTIRKTLDISFIKAFNFTLTGITAGLLTPNRVGEIPFRALMLGRDHFKELTLKTLVSSYSQLIITVLIGSISLLFIQMTFSHIYQLILIVSLFLIAIALVLLYFKFKKMAKFLVRFNYFKKHKFQEALNDFSSQELLIILALSLFRYLIFSIQYYLVLFAFGVELLDIFDLMLIPLCFLITSVIPTILISEIGVRGSVALFVFGLISDLSVSIVAASVIMWIINVAFPALLGLVNLKQLKILKTT